MKSKMLSAILILLVAGCEKPTGELKLGSVEPDKSPTLVAGRMMLCQDCAKIRELQWKSHVTDEEEKEIQALKDKLFEQAKGIASWNQARGKSPIDLHPGCDCPCHFQPIPNVN